MLTEKNGVNIDISDAGDVTIFAINNKTAENVWEKIKVLIGDIEVGTVYEGKITKLIDSGAFVSILPNKDGFLHISEVSGKRIENISDVLQEGQVVKVKVIDVDRNGRVRLSIREAENA
jgi:polyribonucleotide nucleotidyltransferase